MAAAISGIKGLCTSWSGNSGLISGGVSPRLASINLGSLQHDSTIYKSGGIIAALNYPGLKDGTGSIETILSPVSDGRQGLVTASNNYDTGAKRWEITINISEYLTTEFDASGLTFQSYIPGHYSWSGSYVCNLHDNAASTLPALDNEDVVFKIRNDDTNNHALNGLITVESISASAPIGGLVEATFNFVGSDQITSAGSTDITPIFPAGLVGAFSAGEMVLQLNDGNELTVNAFPTSITISCDPQNLITVNTNFRMSGAYTITAAS
jgi:hypothetical protein